MLVHPHGGGLIGMQGEPLDWWDYLRLQRQNARRAKKESSSGVHAQSMARSES